jgi:hypothetical protein
MATRANYPSVEKMRQMVIGDEAAASVMTEIVNIITSNSLSKAKKVDTILRHIAEAYAVHGTEKVDPSPFTQLELNLPDP